MCVSECEREGGSVCERERLHTHTPSAIEKIAGGREEKYGWCRASLALRRWDGIRRRILSAKSPAEMDGWTLTKEGVREKDDYRITIMITTALLYIILPA